MFRDNVAWDVYFANHPYSQVQELRTIDPYFNRAIDGSYSLYTLDDVDTILDMLPKRQSGQYYSVIANALMLPPDGDSSRLTLLGHDVSDETWTSSLTNCGMWQGELEPVVRSVNKYGLLDLEPAKRAQRILPRQWPGDPHADVTVWALFELQV